MSKISGQLPRLSAIDQAYLALRAGPTESSQLVERYGTCAAVNALVRRGHATRTDSGWGYVYRLTPDGLAACPQRRAIEREIKLLYRGEALA